MAWELQQHMHSHIAPSVAKAAEASADAKDWLADRYADQRWDEDTGDEGYAGLVAEGAALADLGMDLAVEAIAEKAIECSTTTNGGWEVYLDNHTSIPWCTEDELQEWYA